MNIGGLDTQAAVTSSTRFSLNIKGKSPSPLSAGAGETPPESPSANDPIPVSSGIISQALTASGGLSMFAPTIGLEGGHSKYTQATLNSFSVAGNVSNSMRGSMMDMLQDYGGMSISGTYFGRASDEDKYSISKKMKGQQAEEIWENSEKLLEEAIDEIEQNAEDAAMPRDEQGNPIPTDENGNARYDKEGNPLVVSESGEPIRTTQSPKPAAPQIVTPTVNAADVAGVTASSTSAAQAAAPQVEASAAPALQARSSQPVKGTEIDLVV